MRGKGALRRKQQEVSRATRADAADSSAGPRHLPSRAEKSAFSMQASTTIIMIVRIMPKKISSSPFTTLGQVDGRKCFQIAPR